MVAVFLLVGLVGARGPNSSSCRTSMIDEVSDRKRKRAKHKDGLGSPYGHPEYGS